VWRRPRLVTANTKRPGTAAGQNPPAASSLRAGSGGNAGDGSGPWAESATVERREAGLPVAREGPCLASVASRVTCATTSRLDASRRSANPPRWGSAATKVKTEGRRTRRQECTGNEETGLFDMVNRKRRGAMHRRDAGAPSRQRQRARVPAERAPRRAFFARGANSRARAGTQGHTTCCGALGAPSCSFVDRSALVQNETNRTRGRCALLSATNPFARMTLGRAALAPQLSDRPVCEPPQVPLAVLSQSREASG
jgi:hypothetical protein